MNFESNYFVSNDTFQRIGFFNMQNDKKSCDFILIDKGLYTEKLKQPVLVKF